MVWGKYTPEYEKALKKTKNAPIETTFFEAKLNLPGQGCVEFRGCIDCKRSSVGNCSCCFVVVTFDDGSGGSDDKAEHREEEEASEHVQLPEEAAEKMR